LSLPLAIGHTFQTGSAGIVPPRQFDSVDKEYLLLAFHNSVEAQLAQSLKL
jgi:hypothetical protein